MAHAMLDARQEGDSYRRVGVITGNAGGKMDGRKVGPDRCGETSGQREHLRGNAAQNGVAATGCRGGGRPGTEVRADPYWC
jgi:hypothetical protein